LGTLIEAVDEYGKSLNDADIVELLFFFVLGSFETTTVFLTNVLKFLSESPHVVDEL
jgi:cytochrome P450